MAYNGSIAGAIAESVAAVNAVIDVMDLGAADSLKSFAETFLDEMYDLLSQEGSGIQYPALPNQSSAPGEPPAMQTGLYRDSWDYAPGVDGSGPFVDIGTPDERGPWLEFGTQFMDPRPHLRPLVDSTAVHLTETMEEKIAEQQAEVLAAFRKVFVFE